MSHRFLSQLAIIIWNISPHPGYNGKYIVSSIRSKTYSWQVLHLATRPNGIRWIWWFRGNRIYSDTNCCAWCTDSNGCTSSVTHERQQLASVKHARSKFCTSKRSSRECRTMSRVWKNFRRRSVSEGESKKAWAHSSQQERQTLPLRVTKLQPKVQKEG